MQKFAKLRQDSSGQIFAVFIFVERMRDALTTPTPVDGHAPHANQRNNTERQSKEASLCNNGLVFLLCGGLRNYDKYQATVGEKLFFFLTEGICTADLDFDNFGTSLTGLLALCIVAG